MSTNLWSKPFLKGEWSGATPGSGSFTPNDLCPEEVILHLTWMRAWNDATLRSLFGKDQIDAMAMRNPYDYRKSPRLQFYLGSLREDRVVTRLDLGQLGMFAGIRFDVESGFYSLPEKPESTIFKWMREVMRVLKTYQDSRVLLAGQGAELGMASRSHQDGEMALFDDPVREGGRWMATLELPWLYHIEVDAPTGKLKNIVFAGL